MVTTVESAIPRTTCQMWPSTRSCNPEAPDRSALVVEPMLMDQPLGMISRFQATSAVSCPYATSLSYRPINRNPWGSGRSVQSCGRRRSR